MYDRLPARPASRSHLVFHREPGRAPWESTMGRTDRPVANGVSRRSWATSLSRGSGRDPADHLHCVWTLPPNDTDYSARWNLIKGVFSRAVDKGERISQSRAKRGERGLWQRRFWEHAIRDQDDLDRHVDYVHWNPVIHGWVRCGVYPEDWGGENAPSLAAGE